MSIDVQIDKVYVHISSSKRRPPKWFLAALILAFVIALLLASGQAEYLGRLIDVMVAVMR